MIIRCQEASSVSESTVVRSTSVRRSKSGKEVAKMEEWSLRGGNLFLSSFPFDAGPDLAAASQRDAKISGLKERERERGREER